ncbi:DUF551 domain-containing protein [Klebsiella variicola]|uniref:DUF551 domain-containing protein n=1 Tax=Klebsiella variicola TaxID=244366 RepID=UPI00215B1F71|nr:DUF551 domain-containing protein [Klebsiella variicola]
MTKSTITREQLLEIIETDHVQCGEASYLARMALAAMDSSESVELPLDYLQGHKDGLEWAARLAEANHPDTGDWLYDDPIELAKAIRKGPDMPPAQPVADSEPVIVVGDDGGDALSYRRLIQSFEPGTKLYRHAQPAPVVPNGLRLALSNAGIAAPESDEMLAATCEKHIQALVTWVKDRKPFQSAPVVPSFEEWLSAANRKPLGWVKDAMREAYDACRAAMLQELKKSAGTEAICRSNENVQAVEVQSLTSINPAPDLVSLQKKAESIIGNYPGIPDCWCCTCRPVVLNDMRFVVCPDCGNKRCPRANDHRNACTGSNEPGQEGSAYPDTPQEVKGE